MPVPAGPPGKPARDRAARIRDAAVASLIAYGTPAGPYVEAWRPEGIEDGDMPRLVVRTEEDYDGAGFAPPALEATLSLVVTAYVERASHADAIAELDALVAQIRDALLGDPDWVRLATRITGAKVVRKWENRGERLIATAHTMLTLTWRELYPPRVPDVLTGIDATVSLGPGTAPIALRTDFPAKD